MRPDLRDQGDEARLCYLAMREAGIDADTVFQRAGLRPERLADPDLTFSHAAQIEFWIAAEAVSGDPDVGLTVGEHMRPRSGHVLQYLYLTSRDFGTGIDRALTYQRLQSDAANNRLGRDRHGAYLAIRSREPRVNRARHLMECHVCGTIAFFRSVTDDEFAPTRIEWMCEPPADVARRERFFGCPVIYGAAENRLYFDPALLKRRSRHAEPELFEITERIARERLERIRHRDFVEPVRRAIGELLPAGKADLERVAERLNLSPTQVRARLVSAGTNFSRELSRHRRRLACDLLADTDTRIEDIVRLTGFSEPSTFYRAFKRWKGETPVQYRERMHAAAARRRATRRERHTAGA
ncbi:AraC family transcriptional regulator [Salinisphaera sp. PC39]|uniref:AraC family transcriptional regulator n=1 Tax=Salinisphaera sp. PC39 TaxID=1304156 RepID=UPI003340D0E4